MARPRNKRLFSTKRRTALRELAKQAYWLNRGRMSRVAGGFTRKASGSGGDAD